MPLHSLWGRWVHAVQLAVFFSGKVYFMKNLLNTVKGHKYSSLSKQTREIFTPVVHTVNRKTWCGARVWSIKAGKIGKNRNKQTSDQEHEKKLHSSRKKRNKSCLCFETSLIQSFNIKFKVRSLKRVIFRTAFYRRETMCHKKIVLKIKSIVMRTTNNVVRKVHKYTHFKRWFTQFDRKRNILEVFHYFHCFRLMKKW